MLEKMNAFFEARLDGYDTPLTVEHEIEALLEAGFRRVEILKNWSATYTIRAFV